MIQIILVFTFILLGQRLKMFCCSSVAELTPRGESGVSMHFRGSPMHFRDLLSHQQSSDSSHAWLNTGHVVKACMRKVKNNAIVNEVDMQYKRFL